MRRILLAGLCLFFISGSGALLAQNKTLGVGVATPNPNAALHVESPTGNQGFILPRLTTTQRTATGFTSILGQADNGLMVYDTDVNTIFIWNGKAWQTTGEVAGGARLGYPYKDSVTVATGTPDLFAIKYNNAENKRVMRIENQAATNGSSTMSVYNIGTGLAGYFEVNNPASTSSTLYAMTNSDAGGTPAPVAIYGESNGTGALGGSFRNTNPANSHPALWAETMGTGVAMMAVTSSGFSAIQGEATGGVANGVTGISRAADPGSYAILGTNMGGGPAGVFNITSATNSSRVISATTAGQGPAGYFEQTDATVWAPSLMARTNGQGAAFNATSTAASTNANAAEFVVENPQNPRNAIMATTAGNGSAVFAENTGAADGFAGSFHNTNAGNTFPAIQASTAGSGSGVRVMQDAGAGPGMDVFMQNASSQAPGMAVSQQGLGVTGSFTIENAASNASVIYGRTVGLGDGAYFEIDNSSSTNTAIKGRALNTGAGAGAFEVFNPSNPYAAMYATTDGTGNAGNFNVNNATSTAPALFANTNGTGAALQAQTASGFTAFYAQHTGATNGNAGVVEITNAANTYPALQVNTAGGGYAINARHTGTNGDAIFAERTDASTGSAGNFRVSNASNAGASLYASTVAAGGVGIGAANDANGVALQLYAGGLRATAVDVNVSTISTRAFAYRLVTGTGFSFAFTLTSGDVFMVYNESGQNATIAGVTINNGEGKMLVVFPGGVVRGF